MNRREFFAAVAAAPAPALCNVGGCGRPRVGLAEVAPGVFETRCGEHLAGA